MPNVYFIYRQQAVLDVATSCEVPQEVVDQGDQAIADYLEDHCDRWDDDEQVVNTEYGSTMGKDSYTITEVMDA